MITRYIDETFGSVETRIDLDGYTSVVVEFDRSNADDDEETGTARIEFVMDPKLARKVARRLNQAARAADAMR